MDRHNFVQKLLKIKEVEEDNLRVAKIATDRAYDKSKTKLREGLAEPKTDGRVFWGNAVGCTAIGHDTCTEPNLKVDDDSIIELCGAKLKEPKG